MLKNSDDLAAIELRATRSAWRTLNLKWELSSRERFELFPQGGVEDDSPPQDTKSRMQLLIEIGYRIRVPDESLYEWLRTARCDLGWLTPLDAMSRSRSDLSTFRQLIERGIGS